MSEPPLCSYQEIRTVLTIDDVANLNEILDLREAASSKAMARSSK
ncbi:hypothetical protein ABLE91_05815 [Aquabacter sp. CN5-332]